jgi:hypothetical protein
MVSFSNKKYCWNGNGDNSPFDVVSESRQKIIYQHNSMSNHFKQGKQILTLLGKVRTILCQILEQGTLTEGEGSVLLAPCTNLHQLRFIFEHYLLFYTTSNLNGISTSGQTLKWSNSWIWPLLQSGSHISWILRWGFSVRIQMFG